MVPTRGVSLLPSLLVVLCPLLWVLVLTSTWPEVVGRMAEEGPQVTIAYAELVKIARDGLYWQGAVYPLLI